MSAAETLFLNRGKAPGGVNPAAFKVGGVFIYGPADDVLREGISEISNAISTGLAGIGHINFNYLLSLCRKSLGFQLDRRLLSPFLWQEVRLSKARAFPCLSLNGNVFPVFASSSREGEFRRLSNYVAETVAPMVEVPIRSIQDKLFPGREKGTWPASEEIMQHVAYLGILRQTDKWTFRVPGGLIDAVKRSGGSIRSPYANGLA